MSYEIHYRFEHADERSTRYLFVISHMRSFSSVLCHILGSHDEISGYAETHQSYHSAGDLDELVRKVGEMTELLRAEGMCSTRYWRVASSWRRTFSREAM